MKNFLNWLVAPYLCAYESNWQTCCYNRLWYVLAVIDPCLLIVSIALSLGVYGGLVEFSNSILWLVAVTVAILVGNITQLMVINGNKKYREIRERLYQSLIGSR